MNYQKEKKKWIQSKEKGKRKITRTYTINSK